MIVLIQHITKSGKKSPFWIVVDGLEQFKVASFDCAKRLSNKLLNHYEHQKESEENSPRYNCRKPLQQEYTYIDEYRIAPDSQRDSDVIESQEIVCNDVEQKRTEAVCDRSISISKFSGVGHTEDIKIECTKTIASGKPSSISDYFSGISEQVEGIKSSTSKILAGTGEILAGTGQILAGTGQILAGTGEFIETVESFFRFSEDYGISNARTTKIRARGRSRQCIKGSLRNITKETVVF